MKGKLEELATLIALRLELQTEILPSLAQFNADLDDMPSANIVFTFEYCDILGQGSVWSVLANGREVGHLAFNYINHGDYSNRRCQFVLKAIGRVAYSRVFLASESSEVYHGLVSDLIARVLEVNQVYL